MVHEGTEEYQRCTMYSYRAACHHIGIMFSGLIQFNIMDGGPLYNFIQTRVVRILWHRIVYILRYAPRFLNVATCFCAPGESTRSWEYRCFNGCLMLFWGINRIKRNPFVRFCEHFFIKNATFQCLFSKKITYRNLLQEMGTSTRL